MSRTTVRKHPTKSSAETATRQATAAPASPGNTAPAPNNVPPPSRVETQAQTPSVRTPMNPAKASSGKGESPVSSSQQPGQCLKQETSQSAQEERLSGDKSHTRTSHIGPVCERYLAGHCRPGCRLRHPPPRTLAPCRNFQEGRCSIRNCPRPHIVKDVEQISSADRPSPAVLAATASSAGSPSVPTDKRVDVYGSSKTKDAAQECLPLPSSSVPPPVMNDDPRALSALNIAQSVCPPGSFKREVCHNFQKGKCRKGEHCPRLHSQPALQGNSSSSAPKSATSGTRDPVATAGGSSIPVIRGSLLSETPSSSQVEQPSKAPEAEPSVGPSESEKGSKRSDKAKLPSRRPPAISMLASIADPKRDAADATALPSSTQAPQSQDLQSASPLKEACFNFSRDRCKRPNCRRLHPPRYEWHKYYEKSDLPCRLHEADMCSAGDKCIFTHYNYSDTENIPMEPSARSNQPDKSRQHKYNPDQPAQQPLGNSNSRGSRVSANMEEKSQNRQTPPVSTNLTRPLRSAGPGRVQAHGRRASEKARMTVENYETTETESDNSSVDSLSPQVSPSIATITLHDDTRSTDEEHEKGVCWDYLHGRCLRASCKFRHVQNSALPSRPRAAPLSADSSLSSIASTSTDPRPRQGGLAQERDVLARLGALLETSYNRATQSSTSSPTITAHSVSPFPLVPPGLGIEAKLGIPEPRLPPEPPKSVTVNVVDGVQVTFGPGLEVQAVQTAFESRVVFLKSVPTSVKATEITELCSAHGEVAGIRIPDPLPSSPTMTVRVTMSSHEQASAVAKRLNNKAIKKQRITASLASHKSTSLGKGNVQDGDVVLDFPAPFRHGYAGYATREAAEQAIALANEDEFEDCCVTAEIFDGVPRISTWTVRFAGLPPDAKADVLHKYGPNIGVMVGPPNYTKLIPSLRQLIRQLEMFGDLIELAVPSPPFPWQTVRAYAHFTSPQAAENACRELNGRKLRYLGYQPLQARHTKTVTYTLPVRVFDAIKGDLIALRPSLYGPEDNCRIDWSDRRRHQPDYRIVNVKVEAKEQTTLTRLKMAFEQLLRGDKLQENGHPVWHPFFERPVGARYIEELQSRFPRVLINRDPRKRCIALYGRFWDRDTVRRELMDVVRRLRSQKVNTFPLNDSFISLCVSADLRKLQRDLGEENVRLDLETRTLKVRADEDTLQVVRLILRNARRRHNGHRHARGNDCPVCFTEVTLPVTLPCGHTWCKSCLSDYLMASVDTKVFPLLCLGDEARCKQPLPITVAREILSQERFAQVTNAAFLGHVHSRPNEFYYCPTPDCPQVYRSAPPNTVLQCPSCLVRICGNCHVEEHVGKTCTQRDDEERRQYERWAEHRDVKDCPNCKTHIERIAGCNHVLCAHCKTHICWVCLKTWPTAEAVYNHMSYTHGGIGL